MPVDPLKRIQHLHQALDDNSFETVSALIAGFRAERALLGELPAVFEGALESILERLESMALFSEESCSFSQSDMLAALSIWLEKARSYLEKQAGLAN